MDVCCLDTSTELSTLRLQLHSLEWFEYQLISVMSYCYVIPVRAFDLKTILFNPSCDVLYFHIEMMNSPPVRTWKKSNKVPSSPQWIDPDNQWLVTAGFPISSPMDWLPKPLSSLESGRRERVFYWQFTEQRFCVCFRGDRFLYRVWICTWALLILSGLAGCQKSHSFAHTKRLQRLHQAVHRTTTQLNTHKHTYKPLILYVMPTQSTKKGHIIVLLIKNERLQKGIPITWRMWSKYIFSKFI